VFADPPLVLGEGPVWDADRGELLVVDIDRGAIWIGSDELLLEPPISMVQPRISGGYIVATRDGLVGVNASRTQTAPLIELEPGPSTRMNDGKCDPVGRLWIGSMSARTPRESHASALYRLDSVNESVRVLSGVTLSNGLGWSPDASTMYYIDTGTGGVDAFDYALDSGDISRRRRFVDINRGRPDGLCVDADGCIWVGLWTGGAVHRYAPDGTLDREINLPVSQVTSCCFGGSDLDTLFITTAARDVREYEQHAGAIFACRPGVKGVPVARFGG
jgi:sugar lactone lactonase YvrE